MLQQEPGIGLPELARTAVAGIASIRENLRGGLAGIEIRLGLRREHGHQGGGADHP
jgi:hypothetical protein